ncbi:MAG: YihY/virulence factor BrkB family protein [Fibrobacteria bacterium]|nr:YihY/virulence factor BrkB family protein [Fibrobacteria bacterium]
MKTTRFQKIKKFTDVRYINNFLNQKATEFDHKTIWDFVLKFLKILYYSLLSFRTNQVPVRASALTYTSLLAFVPIIILLSVFAGKFGYLELVSKVLPSLSDSFGFEVPLDEIQNIITHAQTIKLGGMGAAGSFFLVLSFLLALSNLEKAMNIIWGTKRNRSWAKRFVVYIPFLIFLLLFVLFLSWILVKLKVYLDMLIMQAMGHQIETVGFGGVTLGIMFLVWGFINILYVLIPYTKVRLRSAITGATFSTLALFGFFYLMLQFQSYLFMRYSALYGSLAVFPLIMVLLYISWIIILYGVALTYGHQKANL